MVSATSPPECNFTPVLNTTVKLFPGWVPLQLLCVPTQKWVHLWGKSYVYMLLSLFLFLKMKWKMLLWNIYISPHNTELSFPSDYYKNLKLWIVEPSDSSFNKNVLLDPFQRPLKSLQSQNQGTISFQFSMKTIMTFRSTWAIFKYKWAQCQRSRGYMARCWRNNFSRSSF